MFHLLVISLDYNRVYLIIFIEILNVYVVSFIIFGIERNKAFADFTIFYVFIIVNFYFYYFENYSF